MNPGNAIEVRNMYKSFKISTDRAGTLKDLLVIRGRKKAKRLEVLNDVSLDIKKGETVALIGTNGSGKSTLLKLMTRIIYPNSGTIETDGKVTSLLELGAGFHQDFTGRENIYFNAAVFGLTEKEINDRLDDIIAFSELEEFIDEPVRTYSSGMYMRLAFSVAINVEADILLIDEILAVGDQHFQEKCYAKLYELKDQGKTIVFVSHDLEVVSELCTRAVWIYKSHIRMDGKPDEVIAAYRKQIAEDHKVQKAEEKAKGVKHEGELFIDLPQEGDLVDIDGDVVLRGWKVSDSFENKIEVYLGDRLIETEPERRQDVFNVKFEKYGQFIDVNTVGWTKTLKVRDFEDQISKMGTLTLRVILKDANDFVISEKAVTFMVSSEEDA
ncbi:MAG: ABC transporter ATP-binding protein [Erysipelotrichaceae bacterium]|nr:ABC transporter ATP-binding protein [Erysipelotrichaceae bacterium]